MTSEERNNLKKLIMTQIIADFTIIKEKSKGEDLYGFGLGLVDDITGFFSVGNSIESLKRTLKDTDFCNSYLWCISEWEYDGEKDSSVHDFLTDIIEGLDYDEYQNTRKAYEEILIESLKECKDNGVFDKKIIVYLHYADCFNEEIDDISSEIINSTELHNTFKNRWSENQEDNLTTMIMSKIKNNL